MGIPKSFIFLILLLLFIVVILFCAPKEGFVTFGYTNNSLVDVIIPQYSTSKPAIKLHDSLFFDKYNANLIEVDSTTYNGNVDLNGNTISKMTVFPRIGNNSTTYTVSTSQNVIPTGSNVTEKSMTSKAYESKSANTDKYTVFYIPYLYQTYIHLLNTTDKKQIASFMFGSGNTANNYEFKTGSTYDDTQLSELTSYVNDTDANNNTEVLNTDYSNTRKIFQLSKYVSYDMSNGNLIIFQGDGNDKKMNIYKRDRAVEQVAVSGTVSNQYDENNSLANMSYTTITAVDACGQLLVVYVPSGTTSMITLIGLKDINTSQYDLKNVKRFTKKGVDYGDLTTNPSSTAPGALPSGSQNTVTITSGTMTDSDTGTSCSGDMDDYLLKTKIVPPICPACPSCPKCEGSSGVCGSCGGNGGSGTLSNKGNTLVNNTSGDPISNTVGVVGNVGEKAIETTGKLAEKGIDTTVDVAKAAGSGAADLVKPGVDIVSDAAKETGSAIKSGAEYTGGVIGNVASKTGDFVGDVLSTTPTQVAASQQQDITTTPSNATANTQVTPSSSTKYDVYSRYGQLSQPEDKMNYMPITADFSAFSK
jgi:hypothetical protein|uniref:Uncharacterized protein n=1 Tax=viral metagenome TaxID=1070528 RepID=A0A6C0ILV5_9ZZZZ